MSEKELSKALLRGESMPDIGALTQRVMRRDRRRVWLAAVGCVIAWMLVVMLPWATVLPMIAQVTEGVSKNVDPTTTQSHREMIELAQSVRWATKATFLASIVSMLLAAVCTVAFIALSRRATLRQVNAQLSLISSQLKTLTRPPN